MTDRLPSNAASKPAQWQPVLTGGVRTGSGVQARVPLSPFSSGPLTGLWSERPGKARVHTHTPTWQAVWLWRAQRMGIPFFLKSGCLPCQGCCRLGIYKLKLIA